MKTSIVYISKSGLVEKIVHETSDEKGNSQLFNLRNTHKIELSQFGIELV